MVRLLPEPGGMADSPTPNDRRRGAPDRRTRGGMIDPRKPRSALGPILFVMLALLALSLFTGSPGANRVPYSELKNRIQQGQVKEVTLSSTQVSAVPIDSIRESERGPKVWRAVRVEDEGLVPLLDERRIPYQAVQEGQFTWIWFLLPVLLMIAFWTFMMRRMNPTQGVLTVGKSRARIVGEEGTGVTFDDVAGVDEAKQETQEIVEFLKHPDKFARLGAKIPKGVLLVGPPGTGKTLLARAVAGEAGVTYFQISGAEFVEMFVGVGAARVRDLFAQAKAQAPCIIFIDELDALGKARTPGGVLGGNDEREQTLNQLLVEMDGFDPRAGVIIMAATNRPEILDPALLRPGRFDRQILVDRPDVKGRLDILRIHSKGMALDPASVDLERIARRTPGFVGADLANLLNEAALLAARRDKPAVTMQEIDDAVDRIVAGLEKKNRLINEKERTIVAYHEAGHAIVAERVPTADPVHKISIIPRGVAALGYTQQLPTEDRYLLTKQELMDRIAVLLGGRVAEEIVFNEISTGAGNDLERVTELARSMVMEYGMSRELGPVNLSGPRRMQFLQAEGDVGHQRTYSEETAREIDSEIRGLIDGTYERVRRILTEDREALEVLAQRLLEVEVVDEADLRRILNLPPRKREPSEDRIVAPPPVNGIMGGGETRAASEGDETLLDGAAD